MKNFVSRKVTTGNSMAPKLICFPASGGLGAAYLSWSARLTTISEIIGVDLPGRGSASQVSPKSHMTGLIEWLSETLAPYAQDAVFYGHSFGALCAFETARSISEALGSGPELLIVGASSGTLSPNSEFDFACNDSLTSLIKKLGGTPDIILKEPSLRGMFLNAIRNDFELAATHQGHPDLKANLNIHSIAGTEDSVVPAKSVREWRKRTSKRWSHTDFAGGHFFYKEHPEAFFALIDNIIAETIAGQDVGYADR